MRARSMKMNYVVALALEDRAQLDARCQVNRVADADRMTPDARVERPLPEPSRGIADQLRAMPACRQRQRQSEHLRLAPGETKLGIDARDAQRRASSVFAIGSHLVGVVMLNRLRHHTVRVASIEKSVIPDCADRRQRVAKANLLALFVSPPRV